MKKCWFAMMILPLLWGCGEDKTGEQIAELQVKVLAQEQKILNLEKDLKRTDAELSALRAKLPRERRQPEPTLQKMSEPTELKKITPLTKDQLRVRSRAEMKDRANRERDRLTEDGVERRAVAVVRSMTRSMTLDKVTEFMNEKAIVHPDGQAWTEGRLRAFMRKHNLMIKGR